MPVGIWLRFQEELKTITQVLCTTFCHSGYWELDGSGLSQADPCF